MGDEITLIYETTGRILVRRYRTAAAERMVNRIGKSACDQCAICSELCPRHLLATPSNPTGPCDNCSFSASVAAGIDAIKSEGMLVIQVVISGATETLFREHI